MKVRSTILWPCAAALLFTACSEAQVPTARLAAVRTLPSQDARLRKEDLIYVTNHNAEVTVYNFSTQALVAVLTRFTQPMGECVDSSANVYIADSAAQKIYEYAHGGSRPIKTLDDSPDSPYTCAVDSVTGNLAVANNNGNASGNIAIWSKASGKPTRYTDSGLIYFEGCAYDASGNLLTTNGIRQGYATAFAWLPHGASKLTTIAMPGPYPGWEWNFIYGIQWDGHFFVLDRGQGVFRVSVIHGLAYYIGETELIDGGESGPYWIYVPSSKSEFPEILGGTETEGSYSAVEAFGYPGGGNELFTITHGVDLPFGVVVSPKTQ